MVEPVGKVVVYMGEECVRVYTNVRPVFGVRTDTKVNQAIQKNKDFSKNTETKSFSKLMKEAIEKNKE